MTLVSGAEHPQLLWPLNNKTYAREIIQSPNEEQLAGCGVQFVSDIPPDFSSPAISLNGASYLDIKVDTIIDTGDKHYAFSGWFKTFVSDGALFHYRTNVKTAQFQGMKVVLDSQKLSVTRELLTKNETISSTAEVNLDTWYYIAYGIDYGNGNMKVYLDKTKVIDDDLSFDNNIKSSFPGIMRIGGTFENTLSPLTVYITCFAFYKNTDSPNQKDSPPPCENTVTSSLGMFLISF